MKVAFDVDGTLIYPDSDTPRYEVIALFKSLESFGCDMYIWSGGGINYAQRWSEKLGLKATIKPKRAPMAWLIANLKGAILLATSNRSEIAVGYATMDGDTAGGLAPIGGIDYSSYNYKST